MTAACPCCGRTVPLRRDRRGRQVLGVHYVEALRPCPAAHHTISQAVTLAPAPVNARPDEAKSDAGS